MPLRRHIRLTPANRATFELYARRVSAIGSIIVAVALFLPVLDRNADVSSSAQAQGGRLDPACTRWDEAASETIVHLVQSKRDVDLRQVGDAIFRMRRARRNCDMGWVRVACQDYHSIMRGGPGTSLSTGDTLLACAPAVIGAQAGAKQ